MQESRHTFTLITPQDSVRYKCVCLCICVCVHACVAMGVWACEFVPHVCVLKYVHWCVYVCVR